jgi:parvulin-like peptidyl-prolyl isomerase
MSQDIKMEMIKRKIFEKMHEENDDYEYDEEKLKEFYINNKNMFQVGEAVKVRHIFVATKDIKNEKDYSKSLNKIKKAEELLKSCINFEKVANEYSECPSRDSGGDLGIVKKGQLGEDFDQYAFNIKENEISEIFETEYGLHIIEVLEKYENYYKPYEKVKSRLIDNIKTERVVYFFEKLLEELRDNAQIEIYSI